MRSRKAMINVLVGIILEVVTVVCGFILPRLILSYFGSAYNGIISSISQFLGYISLLKAGVGAVTKAALYKPLAENDNEQISAIINATNQFLRRVAIIFALSLMVVAIFYPSLVNKEFEWFFTFTLIIILGIGTFVQYYFGLTYQLLLEADQCQWIISSIQILSTILNTMLAVIVINMGGGIHAVKFASSIAFSVSPIVINFYARRKYRIDKSVCMDKTALSQRWDCLGLQIANYVNSNTDMFILTVFTSVYEVSVYSVFYLVTEGIRSVVRVFISGIGAAFGNMFAKQEEKIIYRNLAIFEEITFGVTNFLFSITLTMILSFINVYTKDINDIEYIRPSFAYLLVIATAFSAYRIPYQTMVEVTGRFKDTRNGAFFEAGMNIVVSVIMVHRFGLVGVAIGTLCATVFRSFQYAVYVSKNIVKRTLWFFYKRLMLSVLDIGLVFQLCRLIVTQYATDYIQWIGQAIIVAIIAMVVILGTECVFYYQDLKVLSRKIMSVLNRKVGE